MEDSNSALLYHAHHSLNAEDLEFWMQLARRQGNPILELACGTGRVLLPLVQAGFDLTGLDRDAAMLAFLKNRLTSESLRRVSLIQGDLTAFQIDRRYTLIFLACNTYSTLSAEGRVRTLSLACEHLLPGGVFAASVPNPLILARMLVNGELEIEELIEHPQSGNPVQVSSEYSKEGEWFNLNWHYDHLHPDGQVERTTIATRHAIAHVEVYLGEVERSGLQVENIFGDFDRTEHTPESPHLILCLKKS